MRIDILSIFPEMFNSVFAHSIIKRAIEKNIVEIFIHNIRDFSNDKRKNIDDAPFGGEAGMVMKIEPIYTAIQQLKSERTYDEVIYMSPDGDLFNQKMANNFSLKENIIFLCGHYKGIDQRIRDYLITKEISIGDYVLTGGELPAMVVVDSVVRLIPGVISDSTSALSDSFQNDLLSAPIYTRPAVFNGWAVPDVLLSGNHKEIDKWREEQAQINTSKKRPDLLNGDSIN